MIKHYEGTLGIFDYNDEEFEVLYNFYNRECLKYIGEGKSVDLPKGCIDTSYMFCYSRLPEGFTLGHNFDTSNVKNMSWMFANCDLPEGFSLGDKFDTSNVENMNGMFFACNLSEDFSLGNKFDTSNVKNMSCIFKSCLLPKGFSLGDKFDTSNVEDMGKMFSECKFPEGFTLGDHFDTSNVKNMDYIFYECKFPEGFALGDKFIIPKNIENNKMFYNASLAINDSITYDRNVIRNLLMRNNIYNIKNSIINIIKNDEKIKEIISKGVMDKELGSVNNTILPYIENANNDEEALYQIVTTAIFNSILCEYFLDAISKSYDIKLIEQTRDYVNSFKYIDDMK